MRTSRKAPLAIGIFLAAAAAATGIATGVGKASPANPLPPRSIAEPTITGLQVGQTLVGWPGTWSGNTPFTYYYNWERSNGTNA